MRERYGLDGVDTEASYEAEDWQGLEDCVERSSMPAREALLDVIRDASIDDPDRREERLRGVDGGGAVTVTC